SSSVGVPRLKLIGQFVGMGFPEKMVLKAIEENEIDTDLILNALLTYSTLEETPEVPCTNSSPVSSDYCEDLTEDISDIDSWSADETDVRDAFKISPPSAKTGSLSEKEKKLLDLVNMGYSVEEASTAMERCGPEALVAVLTDFICAAQMAKEQDSLYPDEKIKPHSNGTCCGKKKRKFYDMSKKKAVIEDVIRLPKPMIGFGVPSHPLDVQNRLLPEVARGPPYFYYENVALAPKGVWDTMSRHLYEIEPEFVDSKYFSAAARKRGYIHNLPIENRFPLVPLPPLTINQAFPLSRKWWPSWDTRDKLNCIQTALASAKLTERIRTALEKYGGDDPPASVQKFVMDQSRKWNLVWVGKNKTAPLEPDEVEMILGFPKNHTRGGGISRTDRFKSLGNSFQVGHFLLLLSSSMEIF
ncbi:hypothetical protein M569_11378, partial [Genlisea aurea]